jgi:hypothetical protein
MIRCARAKSSLGYPEVFHRFCGYLRRAENFFYFFRRRRASVVKRLTAELCPAIEKSLRPHRRKTARAFFYQASDLTSHFLLRQQCIDPIRGENPVATTHQLESAPVGPVAQRLVQGTHRQTVPSRRKSRSGRDEFREPFRSCCAGMRECRGRRMRGSGRDRWQP